MKRIIQMILLSVLLFILIIFYNLYFKEDDKVEIEKQISTNQISTNQVGNNIIKNLKYEITLNQNNDYIIEAELSELIYKDEVETVKMKKVEAFLIDKNNMPILVTSDDATYNNTNYYTNFKNNVEIKYLENIIYADNMTLDFKNNSISISDNVKYIGSDGVMKADNMKIDLITKKISIFMNNTRENVLINSKN